MPGKRGGGIHRQVRHRAKKRHARIYEDYAYAGQKPEIKPLNPHPFMFMSKKEMKQRRDGTYVGSGGIRQRRRKRPHKRRRNIKQRLGGLD